MGGYGVFFGDAQDVAEPLPLEEGQTNNRGELRAALAALQGHMRGSMSLICLDSTHVVEGVLGRAQKWQRHKWQTTSGLARHVDLWTQVLDILDDIGPEIQWLHVPSHIGICGNEKADSFADEGRRRLPLLRGHVSVGPRTADDDDPPPSPDGGAVPRVVGSESAMTPSSQPRTRVRLEGPAEGTPRRPPPTAPEVPDIEMLTPTPGRKH